MSASKHTPGPWHWVPSIQQIRAKSGRIIADVARNENDGVLIAAAPDMYKALSDAVIDIAGAHDEFCGEGEESIDLCSCAIAKRWQAARAALAKVEGE